MPKITFVISLPLNLYYHLQLCCSTNPALRNEEYQRDFSEMVDQGICWDFYFVQDCYWFMQRCFIEALSQRVSIEAMDNAFISGFANYAAKILPKIKSIFQRAYKLYEAYWKERLPQLEKMKKEIEEEWGRYEDKIFEKITQITGVGWELKEFVVQLVDSLGYNGLILGEGHYAIGFCNPKTMIHLLIHELVHYNILEAVHQIHAELDLTQDQEDVIDETFARLVEMEVTKTVVPWAEEPIEEKRREAKEEGFLEFFDAVLKDWVDFVSKPEKYKNIKFFMREEAKKRSKELALIEQHL